MKSALILFTLTLSLTCQSQDSLNIFISETLTKDTLDAQFFIEKFDTLDKGIIFFYPDNLAKDTNELFLREIATNRRFKNTRLIGIPCAKTMNDKDNVYFGEYNVSNIQCILYNQTEKDLNRAMEKYGEFSLVDSLMPPNFHLVEINKDIICVSKDRVIFHKNLILDFVDPKLTSKQMIEDLRDELEMLRLELNEARQQCDRKSNELKQELERYKKEAETKFKQNK